MYWICQQILERRRKCKSKGKRVVWASIQFGPAPYHHVHTFLYAKTSTRPLFQQTQHPATTFSSLLSLPQQHAAAASHLERTQPPGSTELHAAVCARYTHADTAAPPPPPAGWVTGPQAAVRWQGPQQWELAAVEELPEAEGASHGGGATHGGGRLIDRLGLKQSTDLALSM